MDFWWLILTLIFVLLVGNDRVHWADVWGGDSDYIFGGTRKSYSRRKTGFQLRMESRKHSQEEVVVMTAGDHIPKPDFELEKLISDGRIDEAREYRAELENIADEMSDDDSLRKYAIYGARIARKAKEIKLTKQKKRFSERMEISKKSDIAPFQSDKPGPTAAAGIIGTTRVPIKDKKVPPPLWKVRDKPQSPPEPKLPRPEKKLIEPPEFKKIEIAKSEPPVKPKERIEFYKPKAPTVEKPKFIRPAAESKPVPSHIKSEPAPKPPEPVKAAPLSKPPKPPTILKPPEPPELPKDFKPPPSGPVTLGTPGPTILSGSAGGYTSGPVDLDAKLKGKEKEEEKAGKEFEEKIDPDDFSDLISL
ncbi:hypothetical protein KAU08_01790 [bacterium]|nr:hypothetical protein [bacterium]